MCVSAQGSKKSLSYRALSASKDEFSPCQAQPQKQNTDIKPVWLRDEAALLFPELVSRRLYPSECDFVALWDVFRSLYSSPLLFISQQLSYYLSVSLACSHCCQLLQFRQTFFIKLL